MAAIIGLLLVFGGLVGALVLFVLSARRSADAVDAFARAPIGCTTTLEFTETGTFYVYEELAPSVDVPAGGCQPAPDPNRAFAFEIVGADQPIVPRPDDSLSYDTDAAAGRSVARFEIVRTGEYTISVVGDDPGVVAAVGRDPDDGVDELERLAVFVGAGAVVLGLMLLLLAGRRSRQAATTPLPEAPKWAPRNDAAGTAWPPEPPRVPQVPVNPQQPDREATVEPPPAPLPSRAARAPSPWAPPDPSAQRSGGDDDGSGGPNG